MLLCHIGLCSPLILPHTFASPHSSVSQDRGVKAVLDKARNLLRDNAGSLDNSRTIDSLAMTESSIKKVHVGGSGESMGWVQYQSCF